MAQLKDLLVNGVTRLVGDTIVNKIQITSISAPTSAGGSTYGTGTSGQVIITDGTHIYWSNIPSVLPTVSASDNGKVLTVVNGAWAAASLPTYQGGVS